MKISEGLSPELKRALYEELQQEFEQTDNTKDQTIVERSKELAEARNQQRQQPPGRKI